MLKGVLLVAGLLISASATAQIFSNEQDFYRPRVRGYESAVLVAGHRPSIDQFCVENGYETGSVLQTAWVRNSAYVGWRGRFWEYRPSGSNFHTPMTIRCTRYGGGGGGSGYSVFENPRVQGFGYAVIPANHPPSIRRFCRENGYRNGTVTDTIWIRSNPYVVWNNMRWEAYPQGYNYYAARSISCSTR